MNDNGDKYHWWAKGDEVVAMRGFRTMLIDESPFRVFELCCSECNETIVQVSDLTDSPLKNEALVLYETSNHAKSTGHSSFDGYIKPAHAIERIDTTIEVNNV